MKKRIPSFLAGALTTALVCGLSLSALAANGLITIDVDPNVSILVNSEIFQPKNAQGEDVLLFNYGGTVYGPVRALAEAYGLEVGWDESSNMATVDQPTTPPDSTSTTDNSDWTPEEEAAYQEFRAMWEVDSTTDTTINMHLIDNNIEGLLSFLAPFSDTQVQRICKRMDSDNHQLLHRFYYYTKDNVVIPLWGDYPPGIYTYNKENWDSWV